MKKFYALLLLAALLGLLDMGGSARADASSGTESIAAVVNNDAVTASEVAARMKLIVASSGLPDSPEVRAKLKSQVTSALVDERIMMQEAKRDNITVSKDEIESGFGTIARQNNLQPDQFRQMLAHSNIPVSTLQGQIESQIAWGKVVQQKIRPDISVTDDEIEAAQSRVRADMGKTQYLVADIFLPVTAAEEENGVHQLADKLAKEITQGHAPFQRVASQFSQAPGAARGGDMGWVQQGQLPPVLDQTLASMAEASISPPVRASDGYHILALRKKTSVTEQSLPSKDDLMEKLGTEKLDRAQRRFLMELKAQAFIDRRGV